jgi:sulfur-carrier protein
LAITTRYFASARAAAGVTLETLDFPGGTLAQFLPVLRDRHGEELGRLLGSCSFFVDGTSVADGAAPLGPNSTVDVLPPFAGG